MPLTKAAPAPKQRLMKLFLIVIVNSRTISQRLLDISSSPSGTRTVHRVSRLYASNSLKCQIQTKRQGKHFVYHSYTIRVLPKISLHIRSHQIPCLFVRFDMISQKKGFAGKIDITSQINMEFAGKFNGCYG